MQNKEALNISYILQYWALSNCLQLDPPKGYSKWQDANCSLVLRPIISQMLPSNHNPFCPWTSCDKAHIFETKGTFGFVFHPYFNNILYKVLIEFMRSKYIFSAFFFYFIPEYAEMFSCQLGWRARKNMLIS